MRWTTTRFAAIVQGQHAGNHTPSIEAWQADQLRDILMVTADPSNNRLDQNTPHRQPPLDREIPDLHSLAITWFEDTLKCRVSGVTLNHLVKIKDFQQGKTLLSLIIQPTPARFSRFTYFLRLRKYAIRLKMLDIPVICILPDTFYPETMLVARIFLSRLRGISIFLQSTSDEARCFGYPNPVDKVFWTWPRARSKRFQPAVSWDQRQNTIILPSDTGDQRRQQLRTEILSQIPPNGKWTTLIDGRRSREEYIEILRTSKICVTTNWVQSQFKSGPWKYAKRVPEAHTTGRVWEAFAAGVALVTQRTGVLDALGFEPNVHYFHLANATEFFPQILSLQDVTIQNVARNGHDHFENLLRNSQSSGLRNILDTGAPSHP